ncbi:hypothetical protein ADUPG1_008673 [Aduncisulcus paluster]|uniref:Uncharacterized protein n=2 Tax=Aduncisulcus paluster TaxID=2918883 RepID=A0ABQ5KSU0_9EUKA|nr:hypothetical protein ADUPG1_008673 [Aduncisulcus paluster]
MSAPTSTVITKINNLISEVSGSGWHVEEPRHSVRLWKRKRKETAKKCKEYKCEVTCPGDPWQVASVLIDPENRRRINTHLEGYDVVEEDRELECPKGDIKIMCEHDDSHSKECKCDHIEQLQTNVVRMMYKPHSAISHHRDCVLRMYAARLHCGISVVLWESTVFHQDKELEGKKTENPFRRSYRDEKTGEKKTRYIRQNVLPSGAIMYPIEEDSTSCRVVWLERVEGEGRMPKFYEHELPRQCQKSLYRLTHFMSERLTGKKILDAEEDEKEMDKKEKKEKKEKDKKEKEKTKEKKTKEKKEKEKGKKKEEKEDEEEEKEPKEKKEKKGLFHKKDKTKEKEKKAKKEKSEAESKHEKKIESEKSETKAEIAGGI